MIKNDNYCMLNNYEFIIYIINYEKSFMKLSFYGFSLFLFITGFGFLHSLLIRTVMLGLILLHVLYPRVHIICLKKKILGNRFLSSN